MFLIVKVYHREVNHYFCCIKDKICGRSPQLLHQFLVTFAFKNVKNHLTCYGIQVMQLCNTCRPTVEQCAYISQRRRYKRNKSFIFPFNVISKILALFSLIFLFYVNQDFERTLVFVNLQMKFVILCNKQTLSSNLLIVLVQVLQRVTT